MDEQHFSEEGVARRRFLKQAATVGWATPFILTMMSRGASAQTGQPCGQVGLNPNVCQVTTPCGTGFQCRPDPVAADGSCTCRSIPIIVR